MRKSVFDRWITREAAKRYTRIYGGKIETDVNGYTLLINYRQAIAFVR